MMTAATARGTDAAHHNDAGDWHAAIGRRGDAVSRRGEGRRLHRDVRVMDAMNHTRHAFLDSKKDKKVESGVDSKALQKLV